MAHHVSRMIRSAVLAAVLLFSSNAAAQQPADKPRQDIEALTAGVFGKDSPESKRAVRVLVADIGMVIAAEKMGVDVNGRICFMSASIGLVKGESEIGVLRGDEIVVRTEQPISKLADLSARRVVSVEVRAKSWTTVLTPQEVPQPPSQPKPFPTAPGKGDAAEEAVALPTRPINVGFKFKIDPETPVAELLPTPVKVGPLPSWSNEDLTKVPEMAFGEQIPKSLPKHQATQATAHAIAKINHLNAKKRDGFLLAMLDQRPDLRGLPFLMGDDCRTREEQARQMGTYAGLLRTVTSQEGAAAIARMDSADAIQFVILGEGEEVRRRGPRQHRESDYRAAVSAVTQILTPESEHVRVGMARYLATIPHLDATKALAKLVLFSPEESVRTAAIEGLRLRREKDYTDILLSGFTYPLPAVSKRAADAIIKLERKDLLPNLIAVLESPDPRLPVKVKEQTVVRELVKINHHKNCLLCHAPGNTDNVPEGVLKVAVPLPGEPMPKPAETQYYSRPPATPDILVRIDMTYLRQDFSLMMPVSDAHPWPDMQRFDFLVRTRELTAAETQAYEPCCEEEEPGRLSPYHRAALFALRELTGRDTEPTATAWRKLLKLPKTAS